MARMTATTHKINPMSHTLHPLKTDANITLENGVTNTRSDRFADVRCLNLTAEIRPHYTWKGLPKRVYSSLETAEQAAFEMEEKTGGYFDAYVCVICEKWHIGHSQTKRVERFYVEELYIELGTRVMGCLKVENCGKDSEREGGVKARTDAVRKRRMYGVDPILSRSGLHANQTSHSHGI